MSQMNKIGNVWQRWRGTSINIPLPLLFIFTQRAFPLPRLFQDRLSKKVEESRFLKEKKPVTTSKYRKARFLLLGIDQECPKLRSVEAWS